VKVTATTFEGLFIIQPLIFNDERGFFFESFNQQKFESLTGLQINFVQDNQASSCYGVLRGLHYQLNPYSQAKLVSVLKGEVLDVVVDIRKNSLTFGQYFSIILSAENKTQLFIPRGFAHGYVVLSQTADFFYKCDNYYNKAAEGGLLYNDETINIDWNIDLSKAILSEKDKLNPPLKNILNNFD
jgi:dTDP-4-dehydrorhamnose 3,5-epimerase